MAEEDRRTACAAAAPGKERGWQSSADIPAELLIDAGVDAYPTEPNVRTADFRLMRREDVLLESPFRSGVQHSVLYSGWRVCATLTVGILSLAVVFL